MRFSRIGIVVRSVSALCCFCAVCFGMQSTGYAQDAVKDRGIPAAKGLGQLGTAVARGVETFVDQLVGSPTTPRQAPKAPIGERFPAGTPQICIDAVNGGATGGAISPLSVNYPNGNVGSPNVEDALGGLGPEQLAARMASAAERVFFVKDSTSPQGDTRKIEHLKTEDGGGLFAAMNIGANGPNPHSDVEMALQRNGGTTEVGENGNGDRLLSATGYRWRLRDQRLADAAARDESRCDSCHTAANNNPNDTQKHAIKVESQKIMSAQEIAALCRQLTEAGQSQKLMFLLVNLRSGKVKFRDSIFAQVDADGDGITESDGQQLQSDEAVQQELGFGQDTPPVNNETARPPIPPLPNFGQPKPRRTPTATPTANPTPTPEVTPSSSPSPSPSPTATLDVSPTQAAATTEPGISERQDSSPNGPLSGRTTPTPSSSISSRPVSSPQQDLNSFRF